MTDTSNSEFTWRDLTPAAIIVAKERLRQITEEGYTSEHDKNHYEDLLRAADAYVQYSIMRMANPYSAPELFGHPADFGAWPADWPRDTWKPSPSPVRDMVKAAALITAALDSLIKEGIDVENIQSRR